MKVVLMNPNHDIRPDQGLCLLLLDADNAATMDQPDAPIPPPWGLARPTIGSCLTPAA